MTILLQYVTILLPDCLRGVFYDFMCCLSAVLERKISEGVTEQTLKYYKYNLPKFIEWCVDNKIENVEDVYTHLFEDYKLYLIENKSGTKKYHCKLIQEQ